MAEPVALTALALDAAFGWPKPLYDRIGHPVGLFARLIGACEARWNRPTYRFAMRRALGILTLLVLLLVAAGLGWTAQYLLLAAFGAWGWIGVALLAWPALAQRSLFDHVRAVGERIDASDLPRARAAVGMIVGRDTAELDDAGVARAAIESLAESFCDGVAAPLFWLLLLGLPGVWAYKAVNTADSLIGHREDRWRAFGWAAAGGASCGATHANMPRPTPAGPRRRWRARWGFGSRGRSPMTGSCTKKHGSATEH